MIKALLDAQDIKLTANEILSKTREIIPTEINRTLLTDWAEENRTLKEGKYQGPYSYDLAPYLREIADNLSAASEVSETAVKKATRMGATVGLHENWIGYTIDEDPSEMAYITSSDDLAGAQMDLRVNSLINSSGIADKIGNVEKRKGEKTSGDKVTQKAFPGGYLMAGGPKAPFIKRQFGFKKIATDEVDEFPDDIDKNGDPIGLIRGRVKGYGDDYKILWASSPKLKHNSKINRLYKEGDQRKYYVPCKHCGHKQPMKWGKKGERGGLKFEHDEDNRLIYRNGKPAVWYECENCGGHWVEEDKELFLSDKTMGGFAAENGKTVYAEWRPTAVPRRKNMRSYFLPGFYSLMSTWETAVLEFLELKSNGFPRAEFQVWVNCFLAETFEDSGEKPKIETLLTQERTYHKGSLPLNDKPLFVTLGADVQDDRIECEIVAWGRDKESWSIDYKIIPGNTGDTEDACWNALRSIITSKYCGMQPVLTGIDAGHKTDIVYEFCDRFESGVHPVMGSDKVRKSCEYIKTFAVQSHTTPRIDINTDLLKQEIYRYLSKGQFESGKFPHGYCHFPVEYERKYFNMLTAEERITVRDQYGHINYKWDAGKRRNEALDCRVYALAMVYAYYQASDENLRYTGQLEETEPFTWSDFWDYLEHEELSA
ncbi:MAG: phage terminase large subunit family protein [Spirochaetales bacterium]|nr:phage terminase large subunit family protein [Spirochaetales bacterium]